LARALRAIRGAAPDVTVCLGDVAGRPSPTARCCELLVESGALVVRGNHDRWLIEGIERDSTVRDQVDARTVNFLRRLPPEMTLDTVHGLALVCHGVGTNDLGYFPTTFIRPFLSRLRRLGRLPTECKAILHGHSHVELTRTCEGVLIVSLGPLVESGTSGCVVVDFSALSVDQVSY